VKEAVCMFPIGKRFDMDPGPDMPHIVRMIVEVPRNSGNKYEFDSESCIFRVSRTLYSPIHNPGDYGFVPGTVAEAAIA
jgi:inorganic pyrophosphatase